MSFKIPPFHFLGLKNNALGTTSCLRYRQGESGTLAPQRVSCHREQNPADADHGAAERKTLAKIVNVAKPETILAWYRKLVAKKFDGSKNRKNSGWPKIDSEFEQLIDERDTKYMASFCGTLKSGNETALPIRNDQNKSPDCGSKGLRGRPAFPGCTLRPSALAICSPKHASPSAKLPFVALRISSTSPGSSS